MESEYNCLTFEELSEKEVINVIDGKKLGCVTNLELDMCMGRVFSLIIDNGGKFCGIGSKKSPTVVPFCNIEKIGCDTILVRLVHDKQDCK